MPNDVDKSLLDRLQALRGGSAAPENTSTTINVDLIERAKTPTREDALAARLKSLRSQDEGSPSLGASPKTPKSPAPVTSSASPLASRSQPRGETQKEDDEDVDAMFQTDDQTLEELLGDVGADDGFAVEPDDAKVKALLEELAQSIPKEDESESKKTDKEETGKESDNSDGEEMTREVDEVIAKFRDEIELEVALGKDESDEQEEEKETEEEDEQPTGEETAALPDLALPEVPSNLEDIPSSQAARAGSADIDDITARLAALRAPSKTEDDFTLPEVPTSKPSGKAVKRLTSKTNYTDDDMDSWCTVCLEDATLRCKGCDDDVYCTRCWREMHIGPSAGFDERSHKAVQFTKDKKKKEKKVALGA